MYFVDSVSIIIAFKSFRFALFSRNDVFVGIYSLVYPLPLIHLKFSVLLL